MATSKRGESTTKTLARLSGSIGVAASTAGIGAAASGPAAAAAAAGLATIPALYDQLVSFADRRRRQRWEAWCAAYFDGRDPEAELFEARLEAHGSEADAQAVVLEGARALEDALSDVVVPHLGRLTRLYRTEGRRADGFFRGMRRLLCDVGEDEFNSLRELVRRACGAELPDSYEVIELHYISLIPNEPMELSFVREQSAERQKQTATKSERVPLGGPLPHALHLFQLLKLNALARDGVGGGMNRLVGPQVLVFDREMVARMWPVLSR